MSFAETFDIEEALKQYLLDYPYLLFDSRRWNMKDESNPEIRRNVLLRKNNSNRYSIDIRPKLLSPWSLFLVIMRIAALEKSFKV